MSLFNEDAAERPLPQPSQGTGSKRPTGLILLLIGSVLVICAVIGTALLLRARESALRDEDKRHLAQIGLALRHYHERYNAFPPGGIVRADGTELMSWQASLLPYLDQAPLYGQIKQDFAWYSPENRGVFSQPIATLMNPAIPVQPGLAVSHYAGNSHIFQVNKSMGYRDITDGTTNTIAVGDVSTGFKLWGDPTNVRDPGLGLGNTPQQFGSPFVGGCHFLMFDGAVRFVPNTIDREVLKRLANPSEYIDGDPS